MISEKMVELVEGSSLIRAMFEEGQKLAQQYGADQVYDYSLGNPNVETPAAVKQAIMEVLEQESSMAVHGYMNNSGYPAVRAKIADYTNQRFGTELTAAQVIMTCGAAGGLNIIAKTLLNPQDQVLTFAPFFGEYRNYASNFEAELVVVPADTKTFQPNLEVLADYITDRTKLVIINSPNNPSGVIYTPASIARLCAILNQKQQQYGHSIYLVADEPYREIVYSEAEVPYIINDYANSLVVYSFSKALSLPGERIGYVTVSPRIDQLQQLLAGLNVANRILGFVNAPSLFQKVIGRIIGTQVDISMYKKNRDVLYQHLMAVGYQAVEPEGAFYLLVKAPIEDDVAFCQKAKQYHLLMVPGSAFGIKGYVRLSYCIDHNTIKNSLPAFTALMQEYHR